jgi:hypothetical protein
MRLEDRFMTDTNYKEVFLMILAAVHYVRILVPELGEAYVAARDVLANCRKRRPQRDENDSE